MSHPETTDRFGDAIAIARAKYGRGHKPKPWAAAILTSVVVVVLIGGIAAALILFS